eukprot:Opistho-2@37176
MMAASIVTDFVTQYEKIWDDSGTGAVPVDVTIFRPVPPDGFYILGDYAQRGRLDAPTLHRVLCVRQEATKSHSPIPLLLPPVDYVKVWEDIGSKPKFGPCSIWKPIPPEGYVAIGHIAHAGYDKPAVPTHRCVHMSIAVAGRAVYEPDGIFIWCDRDSRAKFGDVSLWSVSPTDIRGVSVHTWVASSTYLKPGEPIYALKRVDLSADDVDATADVAGITSLENEGYECVSAPAPPFDGVPPPYSGVPQPYSPPPMVEYVPFTICKEDALKRCADWASSLWFAPSQFATSPVDVKEAFVPFFIFSTSTSTRYFGQVAVHFPMRVPAHQWLTVSGQYNNFVPSLAVAATQNGQVAQALAKVGPWSPEGATSGDVATFGREQPADWRGAWASASNDLMARERAECATRVRSEYCADRVDICSETNFTATTFRVVYMPVWVGSIRHGGKDYPLVVNGMCGMVTGDRPFGAGTLGRGLEAISDVIVQGVKGIAIGGGGGKKGDAFSGADPASFGIMTGAELIRAEGALPGYTASRFYLIFPPSSGLITSNTGYVVVENASEVASIELAGFQRKGDGSRRGFPFEIKAGDRRIVTFRGSWCLEVLSGEPDLIKLAGWGPSCSEDYHSFNMYG